MNDTVETLDTVVIGAGVVGLAVARALALAGREVLVLEAEDSFGTQTSARNSEVIHAGIYYPQGSAKARLWAPVSAKGSCSSRLRVRVSCRGRAGAFLARRAA